MAMLKNFVGTIPIAQLVETNIPQRDAPTSSFVLVATSKIEITKQSARQFIKRLTLFVWYTSIITRKRKKGLIPNTH